MKLLSSVKGVVGKTKFILKVNSPKIKVGVGLGVMIAGGVWACIQTKKAIDELDEFKEEVEDAEEEFGGDENPENKEQLRKVETKATFKLIRRMMIIYAGPTAAVTGGVLLTLNGFGELNTRYLGAVATAGTLQEFLDKYRSRVADKVGVDAEKDLYHGVTYQDIKVVNETNQKVKELKKAPVLNDAVFGPMTICFCERDAATKHGSFNFNKARNDLNLLFLKNAQLMANDRLKVDKFMTVYTLLTDYLGMSPQALKNPTDALNWGWRYTYEDSDDTSDNYIDFGIWDAYWNWKSMDVPDFMHSSEKDIFLDLNAVPLFGIDNTKENKIALAMNEE